VQQRAEHPDDVENGRTGDPAQAGAARWTAIQNVPRADINLTQEIGWTDVHRLVSPVASTLFTSMQQG
jgi:hypothetical protein